MSWNSPKGSVNAQPRALSWIAASVGGLALFLTLASWVLVSHPIGSTVRGYFYSIDSAQKLDLYVSSGNQSTTFPHEDNVDENVSSESKKSSDGLFSERVDQNMLSESNSQVPTSSKGSGVDPSTDENVKVTDDGSFHESNSQVPINSGTPSSASEAKEIKDQVALTVNATSSVTDDKDKVVDNKKIKESSYDSNQDAVKGISLLSNVTDNDHIGNSISMEFVSNSSSLDMGSNDTTPAFSDSNSGAAQAIHDSHVPSNASRTGSTDCDLYHGNWIYDSSGPLYTNNTCPVLTQMQNCQGNGRPDKEYENWRWKPFQCDIPRFDGRKFLELMRGKTIAFIGDSVARNQMESLLCILWQVEVPKNRGNRKMQRFFFKSTSTMVVRIWSSWLVKQRSESIDFAPEGVVKLHLDAPDDTFMEFVPNFDVIVLSSGHWFAKQSVYVLNNKIVGGQLWWPDKSRPMKVNNIEAFGISVETILTALGTHPNFSGIAIVRSYSPDHYEGGAWNTGGSCTGKTKPLAAGELVENGFTNIMHEKQVTGFNRATKKLTNKSKIRLMDITEAFQYRHDGHPGPYRNKDPNKLTKRGPDGKPPPQDCLHWCMPGPVDTWNELVLEIIRREYEGDSGFSS